MTAFRHAHASLAYLDARELDFLRGIIDRLIERRLELENDPGDGEEAGSELKLAA